MTTPAGAKPIITPMPGSPDPDAAAAAAAAGPGSEEQAALDAAAEAAKANEGKTPEEIAAEEAAAAAKPDADKGDDKVDLSLDKDPEPVVAKDTGYPEFDTVAKLMADSGMQNTNEIMEAFLDEGEISLAHKAEMIEALGEGVANMAFKQLETTATNIINEAKAETKASMDYANEKFGGEDPDLTWSQIKEYVRTPEAGFSEADLAAMNTMLAAGGLQAQLVIDKVHAVYTADSNTSQPGTLLEGDAGITGGTFEPISRIDYTAEMGKAVSKFGEDSPQVRELNRRRQLTMRTGH